MAASGPALPAIRVADAECRLRLAHGERDWIHQLASAMRAAAALPARPTRAQLEELLTRVPMAAGVVAGDEVLGRTSGARVELKPGVSITIEQARLAEILRASVDGVLDADGRLLDGTPPLPSGVVPGASVSATLPTTTLRWARVHIRWLPDVGLGMVAAEPIGNPTGARAFVLVLLVFGAGLSLAAWLAATYVTRPLQQLRQAATRLAEGHQPAPLPASNDEVGDLARDFERMAATIARREAELVRASNAKSCFLASVSHELRTPLTAIVGYCGMLGDGLRGPLTDEQSHTVGKIAANAQTLIGHIDDLLDIGRIEAGRLELNVEPVDLAECLESAHAAVEPQIRARGLALEVDLPPEPLEVRADFQRLRQVFVNLLSNAARFTTRGGLGVRARRTSQGTEVVVWDTGPGVPEEEQEHIFEEFKRGRAQEGGGTGLGLAICRRVVDAHEGRISVRPRPGGGSEFIVVLP